MQTADNLPLFLKVSKCNLRKPFQNVLWQDDGGIAWRVSQSPCGCIIPMKFARKQDAVAAAFAIADVIDWSIKDAQELHDVISEYGQDRLRQKMLEAMVW